ncbi:hypothetical protein LSAT2_020169 [Lamellibrachia satsuma]|nr:hypothetical protein LSAT2_020169 [Lamellibrachia satsuma]
MFPATVITNGPERPHTTHSTKSRDTKRASVALTSESRSGESADYEWPDLPPISEIKNAICRQRVSKGLSYLLPVDKTKNSIEGVYRTDLRVTFKGPYRNDDDGHRFNDSRLRASMKHHFRTNTSVTYFRPESVPAIGRRVNSESERALAEYAKSAPRTGISGRRTLGHYDNMRRRSQLYLPPHIHVPPEVIKLRQEADKIVKSVLEKESPSGDATQPDGLSRRRKMQQQRALSRGHVLFAETDATPGDTNREPVVIDNVKLIRKASRFKDYEELKRQKIDPKRKTPATVQSQYLSSEKNDDVWNWLHCGLPTNEFNYFLEVCA